jgi:integrase
MAGMERPEGHIKRLGPNRWQVQVSVPDASRADGRRRISRNVHGTLTDAKAKRKELLVAYGELAPDADVTLHEFAQREWIRHLQKRAKPVRQSTMAGYLTHYNQRIRDSIGEKRLRELTPRVLQRWLDDIDGVSAQTKLATYGVLNGILTHAVALEVLRVNPLASIRPPMVAPLPLSVPDEAGVNKILDAFVGDILYPLVVIAFATGARRSELCALQWSDVDLDAGTVHVWRGLHHVRAKGGGMIYEPPKTTLAEAKLPLPAWSVRELRGVRGVGPLVPGEPGLPMDPDAVSRRFRRVLKDAGLPDLALGSVRHTVAMMMKRRGARAEDIAALFRHTTVETARRRYYREDEGVLRNAAAPLEGIRNCRGTAEGGV